MTLIDRWPFGDARHHPAAVVKYWGTPPSARTFLRPVVVPGPHCYTDGHVPDCRREVLLPPVCDQAAPGSVEERDLMAQAVVVRNAVIMRSPPSHDCWSLLGYEIRRGEASGGYLRSDLTPATKAELHQTRTAAPVQVDPIQPLLRAAVAIGQKAGPQDDVDLILRQVGQNIAQETALDHLVALILAIIARDMQRGFDPYRSWGGALYAAWPLLTVEPEVSAIVPLLDATAVLEPLIVLDDLMDPDLQPVVPSHRHGIPGAAARWVRAMHLGGTGRTTQPHQPRSHP